MVNFNNFNTIKITKDIIHFYHDLYMNNANEVSYRTYCHNYYNGIEGISINKEYNYEIRLN